MPKNEEKQYAGGKINNPKTISVFFLNLSQIISGYGN